MTPTCVFDAFANCEGLMYPRFFPCASTSCSIGAVAGHEALVHLLAQPGLAAFELMSVDFMAAARDVASEAQDRAQLDEPMGEAMETGIVSAAVVEVPGCEALGRAAGSPSARYGICALKKVLFGHSRRKVKIELEHRLKVLLDPANTSARRVFHSATCGSPDGHLPVCSPLERCEGRYDLLPLLGMAVAAASSRAKRSSSSRKVPRLRKWRLAWVYQYSASSRSPSTMCTMPCSQAPSSELSL